MTHSERMDNCFGSQVELEMTSDNHFEKDRTISLAKWIFVDYSFHFEQA